MTIRRALPVPLHDQIRRTIEAQISDGEFHPGDQLPTEHEYARHFGVSLAPVRQALLDLASRGLVVRMKGRGTFVTEPPLEMQISLLESFTESMRSRGLPFSLRLLEQGLVTESSDLHGILGLPPGSPLVRIRRLAEVRDEPVAVLEAVLDGSRFGALAALPGFAEGRSLYATLESTFGVRVGQAHGTLEVQRANDRQAELLGVAVGTPVLLARSVTEDEQGVAIEVSDVLYRADRFTFRIESRR